MAYKAFEEFYRSAEIKHLVLHEHNGTLVSPPFGTIKCLEYNNFLTIDQSKINFISLDLPNATSKFNAIETVGDSIWCIPYAIYDSFNVVLQIKNSEPIYHKIDYPGRGQFYSMATDGNTAFSFPLGYEETSFAVYIKDDAIKAIPMPRNSYAKLHMGTVFCNGKYWSAPRSDKIENQNYNSGYCDLVSFDHESIKSYNLEFRDNINTRKYSDIVVHKNYLYSLPFGEKSGTTEIIEFDTDSEKYNLYSVEGRDFAKKYNSFTILNDQIIGLPYGDEQSDNSQWAISFDINNKTYRHFNIGDELSFGGKYRYRSCVNYKDYAFFFPSGTPACPIVKVDADLNIKKCFVKNVLFGRPILYKNYIRTIGYQLESKEHFLYTFDEELNHEKEFLL